MCIRDRYHVAPMSTDKLGGAALHNFPAFTPTVTNIRPTSRGHIELSSSDTREDPKIFMNYLLNILINLILKR